MTDTDPSTSSQRPDALPGRTPGDTGPGQAPFDPKADPTPPRPPRPTGPVQYKGEDLEAERGPGLGCFRFQVVVLVALIILTPLSVVWNWPSAVSAILLFIVILLLLVTGQTIIFLLRIVAADRRGRRRPLASGSKTVGELEDEATGGVDGRVDAQVDVDRSVDDSLDGRVDGGADGGAEASTTDDVDPDPERPSDA